MGIGGRILAGGKLLMVNGISSGQQYEIVLGQWYFSSLMVSRIKQAPVNPQFQLKIAIPCRVMQLF